MALYPVEWMDDYLSERPTEDIREIARSFALSLAERESYGEGGESAANWLLKADAILKRRAYWATPDVYD